MRIPKPFATTFLEGSPLQPPTVLVNMHQSQEPFLSIGLTSPIAAVIPQATTANGNIFPLQFFQTYRHEDLYPHLRR